MPRLNMLIAIVISGSFAAPIEAAESEGIIQLRRELMASGSTGEPSDVKVDGAGVEIAEAPPLGEIKERRVPKVRRRPIRRVGRIDESAIANEVKARFQEFELCRAKVARAKEVRLDEVKAGMISVRWTLGVNGTVSDTLVFEDTDTDLSLMKCARRRMNAWTFTPAVGGPVDLEYDYRFSLEKKKG